MSEKHAGGRPLKFKTVEELQAAIDRYFAECDPHVVEKTIVIQEKGRVVEKITKYVTSQKPYTITGLALALDTTRETLLDYEDRAEFSDTIKKAKLRIHEFAETSLWSGQAAGVIFNLKNNWGWKDKSELEVGGASPLRVLLEAYDINNEEGDG